MTNSDMEDPLNPQQEINPLPELSDGKKNKTSGLASKVFIVIGIALGIYLLYSLGDIYISPDRHIQQIYLIPNDAAFIIQSSHPVDDWKTFSKSDSWKKLKNAKAFKDITQNVETLDSIIQSNDKLLSLVGKRDMLVSVHKTRARDWDFLIVLDMQKVSKLNMLKDQMEVILKMTDFTVTQRTYHQINILELRDPVTRDILYTAFVDNHFIASYTSKLVEAAIDTRETPDIGLNPAFIEAEKMVAGKGLYRVFINYTNLPQFMSIYLEGKNEYLDAFSNSMDFAGLYLNMNKEKMEMKGYTLRKDTADPYVAALLKSGTRKMKAHEIMSGRTALYTNISLKNPLTFVKELEHVLSTENQQMYKSYSDSRQRIEKYFDISLEEHFLGWMSGEFALSQSEAGLLGRDPELILAVGAKDIKEAQKQMDYIEKRIKKKTPISIKTVTYKGFEVNYVEMKGFFRLFFGGIFDKFEKPYYTYIDDYVVFSNKPSTLLSFIEDYEQKNLLKNDSGFKKAYANFNSTSTLFMFTDIHKFYPQLQYMMNTQTWNDLQSDKNIFYSFPHWSLQIINEDQSASLHYLMEYSLYESESKTTTDSDAVDKADQEMDENAETEKELLSELERFYVEKFQGNILREFYPEGELKSEAEVKEGKLHGRYREYYEEGTLKVRGKYVNNRPKGTWKYYTKEGKFERKEKF